jgi:hypothetical protein
MSCVIYKIAPLIIKILYQKFIGVALILSNSEVARVHFIDETDFQAGACRRVIFPSSFVAAATVFETVPNLRTL